MGILNSELDRERKQHADELERLTAENELLKQQANIDKDFIKQYRAENERLLRALWYNKNRAGVGLDLPSERIDALNDIYETSRDALADTGQKN